MSLVLSRRQFAGGLALLPAVASRALAQENYPNRPIHVIHGYPAGGGADIVGRQFMRRVEAASGGKTFIIENRPGNNGNLAIAQATRAKPDGYTVVIGSSSNFVGARYFYKEVRFDPLKDFVPLGAFLEGGFVLVTGMNSPAKTVDELTAWLKSRPQNRFAYSNQLGQLAAEYYKGKTGVRAEAVAYKSGPEAYPDLQSGLIEFMIADGTTVTSQIRQGKLRPIAMANSVRFPAFPDLPTMREQGLEEADFSTWWALYAPVGTPPAILGTLRKWVADATQDPTLAKEWESIGNLVLHEDSDAVTARLQREVERWAPLVKAAKIEPQ
jgi:tripartite-type tricarboxylate transporter receptor subunit TctC